ncbi:hypothetical protein ACRAVF_07290 [Bradyrhizobium oligotrophicum S58]
MQAVLQELTNLSPGALAAVAAIAGACGAVAAAMITGLITKFFVTPFLGARDKQDKEVEWRKHAIELTKLDLERKIKTRQPTDTRSLRPSILDFLANYRDLRELDKASPRDLYIAIEATRVTKLDEPVKSESSPEKASDIS